MGQTERLYKIKALLRQGRAVPLRTFLDELEVSRATINRDIETLRDRYGFPIDYDLIARGYRHTADDAENRHELPGLWFNAAETHALLAFHHFLEHLEPSLLSLHIEPLKKRLEALLEKNDQSLTEITQRIRVLPQAARNTEAKHFQQVAHALLARQRLLIRYHGRGRDDTTERTVSPQRLAHYRDNWYLDVWDHGKRALRIFAVERIRELQVLEQRAKDISEARLNHHLTESYGIFAGRPKRKALMRFTPERARWVAEERWHPQQRGWYEDDHYFLEIPYSDDRELVLDILKYGPDVEVLRPKSLRDRVLEQHLRAVEQYQKATPRSHRARQCRS